MTVYIVVGQVYLEYNDSFENGIFGVYSDKDTAKLHATLHQAADEENGYLSNFYWVEEWEVM